jgi:hypothetical protein
MSQSQHYADPSLNTPVDLYLGIFNTNAAAAIKALWRPFSKVKINSVYVQVMVAGSLACGFNIYKNGGSIGTIVCSASAAGYRGTWTPATGAGTATSAIYDTTDTLEIRNIDSNASLQAGIAVNYQNQY